MGIRLRGVYMHAYWAFGIWRIHCVINMRCVSWDGGFRRGINGIFDFLFKVIYT